MVLLKRLAGKVARAPEKAHAWRKPVKVLLASEARPVAASKSSTGKDVRPSLLYQARAKFCPEDVFIEGKDAIAVQSRHVSLKFVQAAVLIAGKDVRPPQKAQAA